MTITEFAKVAKCTRDTVYKQIASGRLPKDVRVKKVAGRNFISVPENKLIEDF